MFDGITKEEMLESINESIKTEARKHIMLGSHNNISQILDLSSGNPRIHRNLVKKFNLILLKPEELVSFDYNEIRCCLCSKIVSYPIWYYSIKYAINHFHYFVCFDSTSPSRPSTKCYRRS